MRAGRRLETRGWGSRNHTTARTPSSRPLLKSKRPLKRDWTGGALWPQCLVIPITPVAFKSRCCPNRLRYRESKGTRPHLANRPCGVHLPARRPHSAQPSCAGGPSMPTRVNNGANRRTARARPSRARAAHAGTAPGTPRSPTPSGAPLS